MQSHRTSSPKDRSRQAERRSITALRVWQQHNCCFSAARPAEFSASVFSNGIKPLFGRGKCQSEKDFDMSMTQHDMPIRLSSLIGHAFFDLRFCPQRFSIHGKIEVLGGGKAKMSQRVDAGGAPALHLRPKRSNRECRGVTSPGTFAAQDPFNASRPI
jgi:hypothetical protein